MSWGGVWWSWAFATAVYGLVVGLFANRINVKDGYFARKEVVTYVLANLVANLVAWLLVAPVGDIVIYKEDASLVFTQGLVAGLGDFLFAVVLGGILLFGYSKTVAKAGSLDKE
jgi:energy-coupling factor transport system substrate-specific component